ncbi:MAG TPA: hypothetical protein VED17_00765 [Nitrososphaerales archaeon]|nr:hypothetical protein [Nitrososphaerales archaeon]
MAKERFGANHGKEDIICGSNTPKKQKLSFSGFVRGSFGLSEPFSVSASKFVQKLLFHLGLLSGDKDLSDR